MGWHRTFDGFGYSTAQPHWAVLLDKCIKQGQQQDKVSLASKKCVYILLPFKCDTQAEIISRRLLTTACRRIYAANLRISCTCIPALQFHLKDKVPSSAASFCVYSFTCFCGASYIGRTTRRLSVTAREHHPAWLSSRVTKTIESSVSAHLVDTGHTIDIKQSFQPIYRVKGIQYKLIQHRILATAEAIGIRLFNPALCTQKKFVQTLKLPWPSISSPSPPSIT